MRLSFRRAQAPSLSPEGLAETVVAVAAGRLKPDTLPAATRRMVDEGVEALQKAARPGWQASGYQLNGPLHAGTLARTAAANLSPNSGLTPPIIERALRAQGLDWTQPFSPGVPLQPYYGYDRRPRNYDYTIGRNTTTDTRPDRLPFATLKHLYESYDVAQICTRHTINDLRSMSIRFETVDGYDGDTRKEVAEAKRFLRRPDGHRTFSNWLAQHAMDVLRYDAGCIYRQRDAAGRVKHLKVLDGTLWLPLVDYYGDIPETPAPAFQQFIQGVPWDWATVADIIYQPMWPIPESPYGVSPLETVLVNANTDLRLQMYFLQFFTAGNVPEAFAMAPEDQSDPDRLAEWQETYDDWTTGDQSKRWGLRWLPHGTDITPYKPQEFDPAVAEYVMRRTVAAYGLVPQDLGFTDQVNRSSGDTQMDVQFRVASLPNVGYYQDILDSVLQDDLDLPVQVRFDTGREKEDRLMEAQAHQIYVSMGAESPDEVRDKVLGLDVDPHERLPRFFDSQRYGPIPLSYLVATSGKIDHRTGAPVAGSVEPREFVVPGATAPDPLLMADGQAQPMPTPSAPVAHKPQPSAAKALDDLVGADLARWRANALKRVAKGSSPRPFEDGAIPPALAALVWGDLAGATSREAVDAAFAKARNIWGGWDGREAGDAHPKGGSAPGLGAMPKRS